VRKACDKVDLKGDASSTDPGEEHEEEMEVDIDTLPKKERNKIINQRARDAKKATEKAEKEAQKAKDKAEREAKKGERAGKSKAVVAPTLPLVLIQTSTGLPSQNPCKRDASFAQLLVSRLQQITSLALMDSTGGLCMFRNSSLDSYCPLMHILCSIRPSPRNGWI
jgi:hypothetical protein